MPETVVNENFFFWELNVNEKVLFFFLSSLCSKFAIAFIHHSLFFYYKASCKCAFFEVDIHFLFKCTRARLQMLVREKKKEEIILQILQFYWKTWFDFDSVFFFYKREWRSLHVQTQTSFHSYSFNLTSHTIVHVQDIHILGRIIKLGWS